VEVCAVSVLLVIIVIVIITIINVLLKSDAITVVAVTGRLYETRTSHRYIIIRKRILKSDMLASAALEDAAPMAAGHIKLIDVVLCPGSDFCHVIALHKLYYFMGADFYRVSA